MQLYLWYFGLPHVGIYLSPYAAAVIGFSLCSGAYHSEVRPRGAAAPSRPGRCWPPSPWVSAGSGHLLPSLLPQAVRRALPGSGNELIYLIKYSSLAYMVTCIELTGEAKILASIFFIYLEIFMVVGAIYLVLVSLATWGLNRLERYVSVPGFECVRPLTLAADHRVAGPHCQRRCPSYLLAVMHTPRTGLPGTFLRIDRNGREFLIHEHD